MKKDVVKVPRHLGLIIDGNGRWAKEKGLTRSMGHKAGASNVERIAKECFYKYGIECVSIYCFSTENWNRPEKEVDYLRQIFKKWVDDGMDQKYPDVRINYMGDYGKFGKDIETKGKALMEKTKNNKKFTLNLGINYGGQDEIVRAVNNIIAEGLTEVDKEIFENHLYTAGQPPMDLLIRTSGECRLSNFMLWQVAYAEMYFAKCHWPAFNKKCLKEALLDYQSRDRRFGAIKEEKE